MASAEVLSEKGLAKVKLKTSIFCLTTALLTGISLAQGPVEGIRWAPEVIAAREAAAKFSVPLMIHFYGDACLPCRTLEQRVFSQPEVVGTLNRYFICVAINGTQRTDLAKEFHVHSWPTDIFLSPDGELLFRGVCPQDAREYMNVLTNVAVMNRDRNAILASKKPENTPGSNSFGQHSSSVHPNLQNGAHPELAGIPALGASSTSNSTTPNFYSTAPEHSTHHQLAGSMSPRKDVQSGPAIPALQPNGIAGPTAGVQATPAFATNTPGEVANNESTLNTQAPHQFPPLPGLEVTKPIQHGQDHQHRLANAQGIPQLESNDVLAANVSRPEHQNKIHPNSGPFQLTASAMSVVQDNPYLATRAAPSAATNATKAEPASVGSGLEAGGRSDGDRSDSDNESVVASPTSEAPNLDGYCPVALRNKQWQPGSSQFAVKHLGKVYWLFSESAAQAFQSQPDQYTPALSGYDPQVLLYEGKLVQGATQHGLFEQNTGQVLLFSSSESKDRFQQNFEKNMNALNSVRNRAANNRSGTNN